MNYSNLEQERLLLQSQLDAGKTKEERNKLGQFSTPQLLARDILRLSIDMLDKNISIRFIDPAIGTGSFYSALLDTMPIERIEAAKGYELDTHYGEPARELWRETMLDVVLGDFTLTTPPSAEVDRFNLLICNPPYVRHHHILNSEKTRLQNTTETACGIHITGLAGLYCYFIGLSHTWMQQGGLACWLIPSEFMDVNYGKAIKQYLLEKVTLLRIHRFDPNDIKFDDALVSSAVVWFRKDPPPVNHTVEFTYGKSLDLPKVHRNISVSSLRNETKWTRFPVSGVRNNKNCYKLSDFFIIKRGIATGDNKFFILSYEQIKTLGLPIQVFRPILPSPRFLPIEEIQADEFGIPVLDRQLFLLDCRLSYTEIKKQYPKLWEYLETGRGTVSERYLCRTRSLWYCQEERLPSSILCTYIGRSDKKNGRPFRFILNHSKAIATNTYLLLYPKPFLEYTISREYTLLRRIWEILNKICPESLLEEGRVYGGGLHKLEPKELSNVDATPIGEIIPITKRQIKSEQLNLFEELSISPSS